MLSAGAQPFPSRPADSTLAGYILELESMRHAIVAVVVALVGCSTETKPRTGPVSVTGDAVVKLPMLLLNAPRVVCSGTSCPLSRIAFATLLPSGAVVATDYATLVRFDTAGATTQLARNGNGPGEIQGVFALGSDSAERVLLFDIRRMRQIRYSASLPVEEVSTMPPMSMLGLQSRGGALWVLTMPGAAAIGDTATGYLLRHGFVADSVWTDTIAVVPDRAVFARGSEGMFEPKLPWDRELLWDVCEDGTLLTAVNREWRVTRYRGRSAPVVTERSDVLRRAVTSEEREALLALASKRATPAYLERLKSRIVNGPTDHPVVRAVRCGTDGDAWVRPDVAGDADTVEWVVIGADGVPKARVALPATARIEAMRGPWVAVVEEAESGEERLVVRTVKK
jgi:hypothetical protein